MAVRKAGQLVGSSCLPSFGGGCCGEASLQTGPWPKQNCPHDIKTESPTQEQECLWTNFLPLASCTQFVEAGVKEASTVSKTGRAEETRSACAILRSFLILDDKERSLKGITDIQAGM